MSVIGTQAPLRVKTNFTSHFNVICVQIGGGKQLC